MQTNPATVEHYEKYIDEQRSQKEIVVMRNGEITQSKKSLYHQTYHSSNIMFGSFGRAERMPAIAPITEV